MEQRTVSPWSGARHRSRPRLLVEDPSPALEVADFRQFDDAGFDVGWCRGPGEGVGCPLVDGEDCRLVELADLVLIGPGMAPHRRAVADAIRRRRPDIPVVVQIPRTDPGQCPPGCIPNYYPVSVAGQIRLLWRALDGGPSARLRTRPSAGNGTPPGSTAEAGTVARLVDLLGW